MSKNFTPGYSLKIAPSKRYFRLSNRAMIAGILPIAVGAIALSANPAQAFEFKSNNITGNSATNALAGSQQLKISVTDASGGENLTSTQVLFKFSNVGAATSSITQIYFDNGASLKTIKTPVNSGAGVSFSTATGNLNLPGGNSLTSKFVSDFGIKANVPVSQKGVNNTGAGGDEWVSVLFDLGPNKTLKSVMDEMANGSLRIGMHVQAFGNGGSEAFVNKLTPEVKRPPVVTKVPEPTTIAALSTIAISVAIKRRRDAMKRR
jgi:hypothetical protein